MCTFFSRICFTKHLIPAAHWGQTNCSKVTVIKACCSPLLRRSFMAPLFWSSWTLPLWSHFHCTSLRFVVISYSIALPPCSYPLKSWSSMLSPRILRNSLKAGVSSLFPNNSSSDVWEEETHKWSRTEKRARDVKDERACKIGFIN